MAKGNLSFAVSVQLLTDQFNKGANQLKTGFRNIQMQAMSMFAVFAGGGLGLTNFVQNLIDTSRQTSRVVTALKNVSGEATKFAENQKYLIDLSKKYGLYINDLVGNYTKFTAAANLAGMSIADQQKVFESLSRATVNYGLTADESNGVFLALSQMMGKGTIQAQELKLQMGEKLPVALAAMAKAANTNVAGLSKLMEQGKLTTAVLPKFADELNKLTEGANLDNIETSFNKIRNSFQELTNKLGVGNLYKGLLDQTAKSFNWIINNLSSFGNAFKSIIGGVIIGKAFSLLKSGYDSVANKAEQVYIKQALAARKLALAQELEGSTMTKKEIANYKAIEFAATESAAKQEFAAKKTGAAFSGALKSIGGAIGSTLKAFAPMAIVTGVLYIVTTLSSWYKEQKRINNLYTDYQKAAKSAGKNTAASSELKNLKRIYDDINRPLAERKTALNSINSILGTNYAFNLKDKQLQLDINKLYLDRLDLIEAQEKYKFYTDRVLTATASNDSINEKRTGEIEDRKSKLRTVITSKFGQGDLTEKYISQLTNVLETGKGAVSESFVKKFDVSKVNLAGEEYISNALDAILNESSRSWVEFKNSAEVKANNAIINDATNQKNTIKTKYGIKIEDGAGNFNLKGVDKPDPKETPLQKAKDEYKASLDEYNKQLANGSKNQESYNIAVDELKKKTFEKLSGLLTPEQAKTDKVFNEAKAGVENPLNPLSGKVGIAFGVYLDEQTKLNKTMFQLNKKKELGLITEDKYKESFNSMIDSTIDSLISIDNIGNTADEYILMLKALKKSDSKSFKIPTLSTVDNTFDYKKTDVEKQQDRIDINDKNIQAISDAFEKYGISDIQEKIKGANGDLSKLYAEFDSNGDKLLTELDTMLKNEPDLSKALNILKAKEDVKDLKKELNNGLYNGVKDVANSAKNLYEAFKAVSDTISDVDATGWEKFLSIWDALTNTMDSILSVVTTIETLTNITKELGRAKQAEQLIDNTVTGQKVANAAIGAGAALGEAAVTKTAATVELGANTAKAASGVGASASKLPFPINLIAIAGSIAAVLSIMSSIPKFATGGIVGGGSVSGDKILARVNSGEMILNKGQQSTLFGILSGRGGVNGGSSLQSGSVEFKIDGKALKGVLSNYDNIKSKVK